jgi:alpha-ketoglutarate-dependent taurine dioxygenase
VHPFNGVETLYLARVIPGLTEIIGLDTPMTTAEIQETIALQCGIYRHEWAEGDMVIWDND